MGPIDFSRNLTAFRAHAAGIDMVGAKRAHLVAVSVRGVARTLVRVAMPFGGTTWLPVVSSADADASSKAASALVGTVFRCP